MLGKVIDAAVIERGLRELNPEIHLDPATKLGGTHPYQAVRQGVFYHGIHICSMDRGLVPEYKQWSLVTRKVPVGWEEADKEDVSMQTKTIRSGSPEYMDALLHCMNKDMGWEYRPDGAVVQYTPMAYRKVQGRVVQVGWRHTFEGLLRAQIPGITRQSLAKKFSVDMLKYPVGAPMEVARALMEE